MKKIRMGVPAFAAVALLAAAVSGISAEEVLKDVKKTPPGEKESPVAPGMRKAEAAIALKAYEWGVETVNWDGTPEAADANDVPGLYYDASEVPIATKPLPDPEPPVPVVPDNRPVRKKPVIYFDCDQDVTFDLQVKFADGKLTWMYPKPSRRTDDATVQWDGISLWSDHMDREKSPPMPGLADLKGDHWANFSRSGSTSSLVVNGEHERFIFYEGTNTAAPEVDVFRNAEGKYILRNYSAWAIYDVRARLPWKDGADSYHVEKVAAASGETPSEIVLSDYPVLPKPVGADVLKNEARRAGLTETQAAVFQRCWDKQICGDTLGSLSYRRDPAALDAAMTLTITGPGTKVETARVGYMLVSGIDPAKQADIDALTLSAAGGDAEAVKKLAALGMAGVGGVRRALANKDLGLKQRLALAKVMKELDAARRK